MAKKVLLADDFPLPIQIITESIAIMGRKGSGKTYTGGRLYEQMFKVGAQVVALDPVGNWWGLRLSASGKRRGLDIPVFGGEHGDIPITPTGGQLLAKVVVERGISCVVDLMLFKKGERKRFVTDFAEELFHLKKRHRTPLHLFLEEARKFIPQKLFGPDEARMVGAFEDIVRLGRNYGLGASLIDQRPQSVNKEVLSQTEVFIVHQLTEKHGRKEVEDWVRQKDVAGADALSEIATLRAGEAFLWSPGLLRQFARVKVGKKTTYDASATPELGVDTNQAEVKPLSSAELAQLQKSMTAQIEAAAATDPTKLQAKVRQQAKEIEQLQLQLERRPPPGPPTIERVEIPVISQDQVVTIDNAAQQLAGAILPIVDDLRELLKTVDEVKIAACKVAGKAGQNEPKSAKPLPARGKADRSPVSRGVPQRSPALARGSKPIHEAASGGPSGDLTGPEQRILDALAWLEGLGVTPAENVAVAFLAGYRPNGGAYNNPKGRLRGKGLLEYAAGKRLFLTDAGRELAAIPDTPLTTEELHTHVLSKLPGPEQRILTPLLKAYPGSLTNERLAEESGYNAGGGAFNNPRGRLRTLGLVEYPERGQVRACDLLFLGEP